MSDAVGAHVELVETEHAPGDGVVTMVVRVNGTDVGRLASTPVVDVGTAERNATVTLVLVPSRLEIKGDDELPRGARTIGFAS